MCEIFSTFATVGDPNNQSIEPIEWKPIKLEKITDQNDINHNVLNISNEVSYINWNDLERMQFWDEIYAQFNLIPK